MGQPRKRPHRRPRPKPRRGSVDRRSFQYRKLVGSPTGEPPEANPNVSNWEDPEPQHTPERPNTLERPNTPEKPNPDGTDLDPDCCLHDSPHFRAIPGSRKYVANHKRNNYREGKPSEETWYSRDNLKESFAKQAFHSFNCFTQRNLPLEPETNEEPEITAETPSPIRRRRQEEEEIEKHQLHIEKFHTPGVDKNIHKLKDRRIVDLAHVLTSARKLDAHECPKNSKEGYLSFISEHRHGIGSTLTFKCTHCDTMTKFETILKKKIINSEAVTAMFSIGKGHEHLADALRCLEIPPPAYDTYRHYEDIVGETWIEFVEELLIKAGEEEKKIALTKGKVDENGKPYITVIADGGWSHRSYGHRYTAKSGCAVVIGKETKRLLFVGVRNKYCSICSMAIKQKKIIPAHTCYKNWDESSPAMEADIIVQAFNESEKQHGVRYKVLVADGDSSVVKNIMEKVPYGMEVKKIECVNHLMKNVKKACYKLQETLKGEELKFFTNNKISRITKQARGLIEEFSDHKLERSDVLRIIKNFGDHSVGDHEKCEARFCPKSGTKQLSKLGANLAVPISRIVCRLTSNITSILENETTNLGELFMHLVAKFTGGKEAFYGRRASFLYRTYGASLLYQIGPGWKSEVYKKMWKDDSPGILRVGECRKEAKNILRSRKRHEMKINRKNNRGCSSSSSEDSDYAAYLAGRSEEEAPAQQKGTPIYKQCRNPTEDYGIKCHQPDFSSEEMESAIQTFLRQLAVDQKRQLEIEQATIGQSENDLWCSERRIRATASNYGEICKRQKWKGNLVENYYYAKPFFSKATQWGSDNEPVAIADFERKYNKQVKECGLFVDLKRGYLAASPDGLVEGENAIIEVKCPYSLRNQKIDEGLGKPNFYLERRDGRLRLKKNHNYMYQIQGNLAISGRNKCYFIVWTTEEMLVEEIQFDPQMWKTMLPLLEEFYLKEMVLEILNPRKERQMPVRNSRADQSAQKTAATQNEQESIAPVAKRRKKVDDDIDEPLDKQMDEDSAPQYPSMDRSVQNLLYTTLQPTLTLTPALKNGNKCPKVMIDGKFIKFWNTCGFDSIAMILAKGLEDIEAYRRSAGDSRTNQMVDFVFAMMEGVDQTILHTRRGHIIYHHMHDPSARRTLTNVDCFGGLSQTLDLFRSAPSARKEKICLARECGHTKELGLTNIEPQLEELIDGNKWHENMEEMLQNLGALKNNIQCRGCNHNSAISFVTYNFHIFLLTDLVEDSLKAAGIGGKRCFHVKDLAPFVYLQNVEYALIGVVNCAGGHFNAYVRRRTGAWELHDDLESRVLLDPELRNIRPALIVYVKRSV